MKSAFQIFKTSSLAVFMSFALSAVSNGQTCSLASITVHQNILKDAQDLFSDISDEASIAALEENVSGARRFKELSSSAAKSARTVKAQIPGLRRISSANQEERTQICRELRGFAKILNQQVQRIISGIYNAPYDRPIRQMLPELKSISSRYHAAWRVRK